MDQVTLVYMISINLHFMLLAEVIVLVVDDCLALGHCHHHLHGRLWDYELVSLSVHHDSWHLFLNRCLWVHFPYHFISQIRDCLDCCSVIPVCDIPYHIAPYISW